MRSEDDLLDAWLDASDAEDTKLAGRRAVEAWLDSDPLPVTSHTASMDEEWGLVRRSAAPPPATLLERLDAFYEGLRGLERFVAHTVAGQPSSDRAIS